MAYLESNRTRSAAKLARPVAAGDSSGRTLALRAYLLPLLITAAGLVVWELAVQAGLASALMFPPPSMILRTIVKLTISGALPASLASSLTRLVLGVLLGGGLGLALGMVMGWSPRLRAVLDPFVAAAHPIPKIAILPLIMIFLGIGETSKIFVSALAAFFPMLINTVDGVRQINPIYFEVAQNLGASRRKVFTRVVLPASLPAMLTGLLLAVNVTMLLTIAIEMVSASQGLGWMIWQAWQTMKVEEVYASLVVIVLIGIASSSALQVLSAWLLPWRVERRSPADITGR